MVGTLALSWSSQRGKASKEYVKLMERTLEERLQNCESAKSEVLGKLTEARAETVAMRTEIVIVRGENIELMRRIIRLEDKP